eukprot:SAG31_NODE_455_length_15433_cov_4.248728_1_plen_1124_part_00
MAKASSSSQGGGGWCCTADPLYGNPDCATEFANQNVSQWRGCCGSCTEEIVVDGAVHRQVKQDFCVDHNAQFVELLGGLGVQIPPPEEPRACAFMVNGTTRSYLPPFDAVRGMGCEAVGQAIEGATGYSISSLCECSCPPAHDAEEMGATSHCDDEVRQEKEGENHTDCGGPSCPPCVPGCTMQGASNHDPSANVDDGTCDFQGVVQCPDPLSLTYNEHVQSQFNASMAAEANMPGTYAQACLYSCDSLIPVLIPHLNDQLQDVECFISTIVPSPAAQPPPPCEDDDALAINRTSYDCATIAAGGACEQLAAAGMAGMCGCSCDSTVPSPPAQPPPPPPSPPVLVRSSVQISYSIFSRNEAKRGVHVDSGKGAALSSEAESKLHVRFSNFSANFIGGNSSEDMASIEGGEVLYAVNMRSLSFLSVHIADFAIAKKILTVGTFPAYCRDMPCSVGSSCSYDNFSLWCTQCQYPLISADGLACTRCPSARGPSQDSSECVACEPGRYSTSGELGGFCSLCQGGSQPNTHQTDCETCDVTAAPTVSVDGRACMQCPDGQQPNPNRDTCVPCVVGAEVFDNTSRLCVCAAGWTRTEETCSPCAEDYVKASEGDHSCERCILSAYPNENRTACVCRGDTYNVTYGKITCFDAVEEITDEMIETEALSLNKNLAVCQPCSKLECIDCATLPGKISSHVTVRVGYGLPQSLLENGYAGLQTGALNVPKNIFGCPRRASECLGETRGGAWQQLQCNEGYMGALCNVCADVDNGGVAYGKRGQECVPCSELGNASIFNWKGLMLLFVGVFGLALWQRKRVRQGGKHDNMSERLLEQETQTNAALKFNVFMSMAPALIQPLRIIISFAQVCAQLGTVLMVTLPPRIKNVLDWMYSHFLVDIWALFLHFDCLGLRNYYVRWVLHVFVLPTFLMTVAFINKRYHLFRARKSERPGDEKMQANNAFKGNVFWTIFFCYPSICTHAFEIFECRRFSADEQLLEADYTKPCTTDVHFGFQIIGMVVIIFIAFGVPLGFVWALGRTTLIIDKVRKKRDEQMAEAVLAKMKQTKEDFDQDPDELSEGEDEQENHGDQNRKKKAIKAIDALDLTDITRLLRELRLSADFSNLIKIYKPGAA